MMKILYGIQGTGNGHIARARIMAKAFAKRTDCKVDYVFSGRDDSDYFDMDIFGDYRTFTGLSFTTCKGKVDTLQTIKKTKPLALLRDIRSLDVSQYDLILNDFEPITAWAAKRASKSSIAISHQAALTFSIPVVDATIIDKLITRYFAPCQVKLGVHWFHFEQPIIPPFIEEKAIVSPDLQHFLVYLPFEDPKDIKEMLAPLSEYTFECFHPHIKAEQREGNIVWRKTGKQGFRHSQLHCRGVIANAGFELSSECLQLGKKLLLKPLHGQYEQHANVAMLTKLARCHSMFALDTDAVEDWISEPDEAPISFPDDPNILIDWILQRNWQNIDALRNALWAKVTFPELTKQRLLQMRAD